MFEVEGEIGCTFKNSQQLRIDHLSYENDLLIKRNQVLAQQNQELLKELSKSMQKISYFQSTQMAELGIQKKIIDSLVHQQIQVLEDIGSFSKTNFEEFGDLCKKINHFAFNNSSQNYSLSSLFKGMLQINTQLCSLMKAKSQQKTTKKLNSIQQRLMKRKFERVQSQQLIYFVKDPSQQLVNLSYQHHEQELSFLSERYEAIIYRVKRQQVNARKLQQIYDSIRQICHLKWKCRKEEAKLSLLERSYKLGQNNQTIIQQTQKRFFLNKEAIKNTRQTLETLLSQL